MTLEKDVLTEKVASVEKLLQDAKLQGDVLARDAKNSMRKQMEFEAGLALHDREGVLGLPGYFGIMVLSEFVGR